MARFGLGPMTPNCCDGDKNKVCSIDNEETKDEEGKMKKQEAMEQ